jgi:hypothetical protein
MLAESAPQLSQQFEVITAENYEAASREVSRLVWSGEYDAALPIADKILAYRTEIGERTAALIPYASIYYSAATHAWVKKDIRKVGMCMMRAIHTLDERVRIEEEGQGGPKKDGSLPSLEGLTANELDVLQAVYGRAAEVAHKYPLVNSVIQIVYGKTRTGDFARDCDAVASQAISAGLKKVADAKERGEDIVPHTEIFLLSGAVAIALRQDRYEEAHQLAVRMLDLGDSYPWPPLSDEVPEDPALLATYGQAKRVADKLREAAHLFGYSEVSRTYKMRAGAYAELVPDQKVKQRA